jgi:ABC-type amino acid transport system permease subunit
MIVVGYSELTYTANRVASDTFNVYGAFGTAALLYLVSSVALGHIGRSIERATYFPGLGQGVR